ncbi:MAG: hypothetical protein ABIP92_07920 [Arthrobacter sp.]
MDRCLDAFVFLDTPSDTVHVEIAGNLTKVSRGALISIACRIRQIRPTAHILVRLGHATFVESAALAGLRTDLDALCNDPGALPVRGRGISLDIRSRERNPSLSARSAVSPGGGHRTRLNDFTDNELLTAGDFVFSWLDDESGCPGTNVADMLAHYEFIGQEMSGRSGAADPDVPETADPARHRDDR